MERVLVTGGCGFIGSHLVDALIKEGYAVRVLDKLEQQVHDGYAVPKFLNKKAEWGGTSDITNISYSLEDVDYVIHLAAQVGVGQSAYELTKYVRDNSLGTAYLLEAIAKEPVKKIIVASSMCVYGEGHTTQFGGPLPTPESKQVDIRSIYGLTKYDQEVQTLLFGEQHSIPAVALRLFNTYGSRQALSNPYTGVGAIFSSRFLNKKAPIIFEDGQQMRDFVHVSDVVQGFVKALKSDSTGVFNIGTGLPTSVLRLANLIKEELKSDVKPEITRKFRAGDIRHCYANISKAKRDLQYEPTIQIEQGVKELVEWVRQEEAVDNLDAALNELTSHKLVQ